MNHLFPRVTVPAIAAVLRHPWQSFKSTGYRTMTYLLPFHEDELAHLQDPLERKNLIYQFLFNFYSPSHDPANSTNLFLRVYRFRRDVSTMLKSDWK